MVRQTIHPENIRSVAAVLVGEDRASGPKIAQALDAEYNTVWAWLNRRGMPVDVAEKLANYMEEHALKMIEQASVLRTRARQAVEEHAEAEV
jgi:hypothetical protein